MNADLDGNRSFERLAWVEVLLEGLAESDHRIRTARLQDGWALVNHRGQLYCEAMRCFFQQIVSEVPPRGVVAIYALGGTGRQELCPGSDVDLGIVVENLEDNKDFLKHVAQQLLQLAKIVDGVQEVIKANAFPDLSDSEHFDWKSLASQLDGQLLVGDVEFEHRIRRVCRDRAAELGLEFIFSANEELRKLDQRYPHVPGDVRGFHVKEGKGGLRNFHFTMWLYSFERWIPSVQVYEQVRGTRRFDSEGAPTPKVLDAVGIIFSARCWLEQRREEQRKDCGKQLHADLLINSSDMKAFLARFGAEGLTELNAAREIISSYRHEAMDHLIERGVVVPDTDGLVVWGPHGLRIADDAWFKDASDLFYSIHEAQQRFKIPIDKSIKRAARKNIAESLRPDVPFVKLLTNSESVFSVLKDWYDYGVLDKLVPGFRGLANKLYAPSHRTATLTQAARAMQRVQNLEHLSSLKTSKVDPLESYFVQQHQVLSEPARCALRLALLTEEIPQTLDSGPTAYADSVAHYVNEYLTQVPGLSGPTLRTVEFLLLMKRKLLELSDMSDQQQILESWRQRIGESQTRDTADTIRALALFAYAAFDFRKPAGVLQDRLEVEQWQNVQNLTQNLLYGELGVGGQPFEEHRFDELGRRIGRLLPRRLLDSRHIDNTLHQTYDGAEILDPLRANRVIHSLREVVLTGQPRLELRSEHTHYRLALFAWDFDGLFWRVAGALYDMDCAIRSTDLYNIPDPNGQAADGETLIPGERCLVYDVLTFDALGKVGESWGEKVINRILQRLENPSEIIPDNTGEILAPITDVLHPQLTDLGGGLAKFSCHTPPDNKGTHYAISRILSERAGANIQSIARDGTHDWPIPRTNFYIRVQSDLRSVADAMRNELGDVTIVDQT